MFGPVLHVVRYRREELPQLLARINATGYGLTMGLHTRIDETIDQVVAAAHAGNLYVNRNIVGAVVGVQPFGGEGLSGTGPKAGGPLYLYRLLASRPDADLAQPFGTTTAIQAAPERPAARALADWCHAQGLAVPVPPAFFCGARFELPGPTGERNTYHVLPRNAVLCLAGNDADRLAQLAAVLAVGSRAIWPAQEPLTAALYRRLPPAVQAHVTLASSAASVSIDAVLHHGDAASLRQTLADVATWPGPIVGVSSQPAGGTEPVPLERLAIERVASVNTAAAGGNATLMTLA
ncbi:MAG: Bifunctional protein PutA [Paracidovorax wautersii]|uniref:Bifunctional protein PutA n=1 Tax=Paracidovorax wautersii TaxID=1177982 RepID=A0A7V8FLI8_9BURK|nr:MAG: Bifunctional protein PutA [Paracidovorax wautersii]